MLIFSKVLPADYIFLGLSVATDIIGVSIALLSNHKFLLNYQQVAPQLGSFGDFSLL